MSTKSDQQLFTPALALLGCTGGTTGDAQARLNVSEAFSVIRLSRIERASRRCSPSLVLHQVPITEKHRTLCLNTSCCSLVANFSRRITLSQKDEAHADAVQYHCAASRWANAHTTQRLRHLAAADGGGLLRTHPPDLPGRYRHGGDFNLPGDEGFGGSCSIGGCP